MSLPNNILERSTLRIRDILRYAAHRYCRHASTSSNPYPYPYPTYPNPQPHQIFHLPRTATQQQVKERYYDLVRIYHPDSPIARKYPPDMAQARFQAISKAYDLLRGKSALTGEVLTNRERHTGGPRFARPTAPRRRHFDETAGDERWKERLLLVATFVAIFGFVVQTTIARREAIVQATSGHRTATSSRPKCALADEALVEPTEPSRSR